MLCASPGLLGRGADQPVARRLLPVLVGSIDLCERQSGEPTVRLGSEVRNAGFTAKALSQSICAMNDCSNRDGGPCPRIGATL